MANTEHDRYYIRQNPNVEDVETVAEYFRYNEAAFVTQKRRKFRTAADAIRFHSDKKTEHNAKAVLFAAGGISALTLDSLMLSAITNNNELDTRSIIGIGTVAVLGVISMINTLNQAESSDEHDKILAKLYENVSLKPTEAVSTQNDSIEPPAK